jgi:hypothetical protein
MSRCFSATCNGSLLQSAKMKSTTAASSVDTLADLLPGFPPVRS